MDNKSLEEIRLENERLALELRQRELELKEREIAILEGKEQGRARLAKTISRLMKVIAFVLRCCCAVSLSLLFAVIACYVSDSYFSMEYILFDWIGAITFLVTLPLSYWFAKKFLCYCIAKYRSLN